MNKSLKYIGLSLASLIGFSVAQAAPVATDSHTVTINILEIDLLEVGPDVVINYSELTAPGTAIGTDWALGVDIATHTTATTLAFTTNAAVADARKVTIGIDAGMPANTQLTVSAEDAAFVYSSNVVDFTAGDIAEKDFLENLSADAAELDLFYDFSATLAAPPQTIVRNITYTLVSP